MDGTQFWQIYTALIHAFPTEADLAALVRGGLAAPLAAITRATTVQEQVFDVIHWAAAQGKLADLVRAAQTAQPTHPLVHALSLPPQPAPAQIQRARVRRTLSYLGQWVLVIGLVAGCQLVVVVGLVEDALYRFAVGDSGWAWLYLALSLLIVLTVAIALVSTLRSEVRKRSQRP